LLIVFSFSRPRDVLVFKRFSQAGQTHDFARGL
jgi:hypothetical protein